MGKRHAFSVLGGLDAGAIRIGSRGLCDRFFLSLLSDDLRLDGNPLKSQKPKKSKKTPRKDKRPGKATPNRKSYAEAECEDWMRPIPDYEQPKWWDQNDQVEYVEFNTVKEFQDYLAAIGESLEMDPEGIH